jgi:hypothetical protein
MAAVLETSPEFADEFLPRAVPPLRLFAGLALQGVRAVLRAAVGVPLYAAAARARA